MDDTSQQTERLQSPSLSVDGARIRAIREEKKLTQLYVASLVGVTTDTISRWENNRYPTIKRDNALRLASALEVELAEIVRADESPLPEGEPVDAGPVPVPEAPPTSGAGDVRRRMGVVLLAGALIAIAVLVVWQRGRPAVTAERHLPQFAAAGTVLPVQIKVLRQRESAGGVIVREQLPEGWTLVGALPPSSGPSAVGEVKWLVPGGKGVDTISYAVRIPAGWGKGRPAQFSGRIAVESEGLSRSVPIEGERSCAVGGYHWADENGDGRIDDAEIMQAYYLTEEMKGLLSDWKEIEAIWNVKGYRRDHETGRFELIR
jgi:transcriptional regulator with XRE-family HTH domain